MVVVMEPNSTESDIGSVTQALEGFGFHVHRSTGVTQTVLGVIGKTAGFDLRQVEVLPGVESVTRISEPYKLASRTFRKDDTILDLKGVKIGGGHFVVMAGPCSVESRSEERRVGKECRCRWSR